MVERLVNVDDQKVCAPFHVNKLYKNSFAGGDACEKELLDIEPVVFDCDNV